MGSVFINGPRIARASEKIATLTSSTALTAATYDVSITSGTSGEFDRTRHPEAATIQVETAAIRYTVDGTTPTVTAGTGIGFIGVSGDVIVIEGYENIVKFRAINEVASNGAKLQVAYYY
jgi:hypothetical protein